jgi:hypothetical protein
VFALPALCGRNASAADFQLRGSRGHCPSGAITMGDIGRTRYIPVTDVLSTDDVDLFDR